MDLVLIRNDLVVNPRRAGLHVSKEQFDLADPPAPRRLRDFTPGDYERGRSLAIQVAWFVVSNVVFVKWWCPPRLRPVILRAFGAQIGDRVLIRHRVRIHWPWKIEIGDDCWIGEGVWMVNLEPVSIGHDVCVSQGAMLCCGSHRWDRPAFDYDNAPIRIEPGAWVGARAIVLRGVTVREGAVVGAGAVAHKDVEAHHTLVASVTDRVQPQAVAGAGSRR